MEKNFENISERQFYGIQRKFKKIKLKTLAKEMNCSQALISQYENGNCNMSDDKFNVYKNYILNH